MIHKFEQFIYLKESNSNDFFRRINMLDPFKENKRYKLTRFALDDDGNNSTALIDKKNNKIISYSISGTDELKKYDKLSYYQLKESNSSDSNLDILFKKYMDKDYWGYDDIRKRQIEALNNPKNIDIIKRDNITIDSINSNINKRAYDEYQSMVEKIKDAIDNEDVKYLIDHIRYDQKVSIEIYCIITGENIIGMNNSKLKNYFTNKYNK